MKIRWILVPMITLLLLSGCNDEKTWYTSYKETQVIDLYKTQFNSHPEKSSRHLPNGVIDPLQRVARKSTKRQDVNYEIPDGFFCDFQDVYLASAFKAKAHKSKDPEYLTPSEIYKAVYGKTIEEACGIETEVQVVTLPEVPVEEPVEVTVEVPTAPEPSPSILDSVTVDAVEYLSPEMYDKLIDASMYCERSRKVASEVSSGVDKLTVRHYDLVMDAVLSCKRFELEQVIQQGKRPQ